MLIIKLREAMLAYQRETGKKMTYEVLAEQTGLSKSTFAAIGSVAGRYNATLETIEAICRALDVTPCDLLQLTDGPPPKPKRRKKR